MRSQEDLERSSWVHGKLVRGDDGSIDYDRHGQTDEGEEDRKDAHPDRQLGQLKQGQAYQTPPASGTE